MVGRAVDAVAVTGHDQGIRMLVDRDHGANDGQFVPHPGLQGHVLTDLHAGNIGGYRSKLAADLRGSIRFEVVHVQVRRSTRQIDHDGGPGGAGLAFGLGLGPGAKHAGQGQSGPESPDLEKVTAADAVAERVPGSLQSQHGGSPPKSGKWDMKGDKSILINRPEHCNPPWAPFAKRRG